AARPRSTRPCGSGSAASSCTGSAASGSMPPRARSRSWRRGSRLPARKLLRIAPWPRPRSSSCSEYRSLRTPSRARRSGSPARRVERLDRMETARDDGKAAALGAAALSPEASDAKLVARCRTGDDEAWRLLVERFSRYVYAICVQAFRLPEHDAEDVFQEVFARVYQHLERLRSDEAIRPWIAQLTRRLCIDRLRAASREGPALEEDVELEMAEP